MMYQDSKYIVEICLYLSSNHEKPEEKRMKIN